MMLMNEGRIEEVHMMVPATTMDAAERAIKVDQAALFSLPSKAREHPRYGIVAVAHAQRTVQ